MRRRVLSYNSDVSDGYSKASDRSLLCSRCTQRQDSDEEDSSGRWVFMGGVLCHRYDGPIRTRLARKIACITNSINANILIIDSACDQSIINDSAFVILSRLGTFYHVNEALSGHMEPETALEVVDAVTKVTLKNGSCYILYLNQALMNLCPSQRKSLLQPHQSRAHGVLIDDCPLHH